MAHFLKPLRVMKTDSFYNYQRRERACYTVVNSLPSYTTGRKLACHWIVRDTLPILAPRRAACPLLHKSHITVPHAVSAWAMLVMTETSHSC